MNAHRSRGKYFDYSDGAGLPSDVVSDDDDIDGIMPVEVSCEVVQIVEGEQVELTGSAAFSVLADDANVVNSAALIVRADRAVVQDSVVFLLAANEVRGNVNPLLTPITAAIVGGAILFGMWIFRPRR